MRESRSQRVVTPLEVLPETNPDAIFYIISNKGNECREKAMDAFRSTEKGKLVG